MAKNSKMVDMKAYLKERKPELSDSSISTYNSSLSPLYKLIFPEDKETDPSKFNNSSMVLKFIEGNDKYNNPRYKRTLLAGLYAMTGQEIYKKEQQKARHIAETILKDQHKTEKQEENWVEPEEIREKWIELQKEALATYKKKTFNYTDYQLIQKYILISLLGGIFIPPRRAKDMCDFKIKNINTETNNYLIKNLLVYNSYKTSKTYGEQIVEIPLELKKILLKWIKINPTDYLFFDVNNNPLNEVKINQRLNSIFDKKKVGINQLRRTYLSGKYGHLVNIEEEKNKAEDMKLMGSSVNVEKHYIKV